MKAGMRKAAGRRVTLIAAALFFRPLLPAVAVPAPEMAIDILRSVVKVNVGSAGIFSVFAHDHVIAAPLAQGRLQTSGSPEVDLRFDVRALTVLDPELSPEDRAQVQRTMEGPQVLDVERHPEIRFRSTAVEPKGADLWSVQGTLDLHGQTRPLRVKVALRDGRYRGSVTLRQTDFGIVPVRLAGGTVRVRDEVRVEFEIVVAGRGA
jgi:YceI-like domain